MKFPGLFGPGALRLLLAFSVAFALAVDPAGAQQTRPDIGADTRPDARPDTGPVDTKKAEGETPEEPFEPDLEQVVLQGLDKETARILTFGGRVGETVRFRTLDIAIRRCQRTPPDEPPERAAFLQIYDIDPETGERTMAFSGWMFKSRPALSAMDHPIYDVWVKDCK